MELKTIIKKVKEKAEEIQNNQTYIEKRESELREELKPVYDKKEKLYGEISKLMDNSVRIEIASVVKVLADRWDCSEDSIRVKVDKIAGTVGSGTITPLSRQDVLNHFDGKKINIHFANRSGKKSMTIVGKIDLDLVQKDGKTMASHLWCRVPHSNYAGIYDVQIEYDEISELAIEKQLTELCTVRWNGEVLAVTKSGDILLKAAALSEKEDASDVESSK